MRDSDGVMGFVTDRSGVRASACAGVLVDLHDQIQLVLLNRPLAKFQHLWKLIRRINVK